MLLAGTAAVRDAERSGRRSRLHRGDAVVSPSGHELTVAAGERTAMLLRAGTDRSLSAGWPSPAPPPLVVCGRAERHRPLAAAIALLLAEVRRDPGAAVIPPLTEAVLARAVQAWLEDHPAGEPEPGAAPAGDPTVATALAALHAEPQQLWTVPELARRCGVSRATLARRFTAEVGEPPSAYLTRLRMALAARRIRDTDATLETIGREVGYGSPYAFSKAFTRIHGQAPAHYREQVRRAAGEQSGTDIRLRGSAILQAAPTT